MAGLAVQNFVSAGGRDGGARRGRPRHRAPLGGDELGNFWRDLYRSLVYILLPLALVAARVILISQGVAADLPRPRDRDDARRARTQTIARGPVASQIAIKQLGTNGGGFYNSNSAVPFENPNGLTNFFEMLAILLIPAAQVFMFGRMVARAAARVAVLRRDVRRSSRSASAIDLPGRAARLGGAARTRA